MDENQEPATVKRAQELVRIPKMKDTRQGRNIQLYVKFCVCELVKRCLGSQKSLFVLNSLLTRGISETGPDKFHADDVAL